MKYILSITLTFFLLSCKQKDAIKIPLGGLSYPESVDPLDSTFYIYQYKDSMSTLDSLAAADFGRYFLSSFDEPNLSIYPQQKTIFRFTYDEWLSQPVIINLTEDKMVIKQGVSGWLYPEFEIDRLSKRDQDQLRLSEWYFGTGYKKVTDGKRPPYFDSLFKLYPQLGNIEAYKTLHQKGEIPKSEKYQYSQRIIPITRETFEELLKEISRSGFWGMPKDSWCDNVPTDGATLTLEANTKTQYKIVSTPSCPDDYRKFTIACQKIVDLAGLGKQINLSWDGATTTVDTLEVSEVPTKQSRK